MDFTISSPKKYLFGYLVATFLLLFTSNLAFAGSDSNSEPNGCPVVGIKASGEYYRANQRSCFANTRKAGRKGFEAATNNSTIRGFSLTLNGSEEVPTVTTSATGSCLTALLADGVSLQVICTHTVSSPSAAHVHTGAIGVEGDILCDLGAGTSPISVVCTLTTSQRTTLLNGDLYINVHSAANPDGELRGQID